MLFNNFSKELKVFLILTTKLDKKSSKYKIRNRSFIFSLILVILAINITLIVLIIITQMDYNIKWELDR